MIPSAPSSGARPEADLAGHLALALARHVRDLRRAGGPVPAELEELATLAVGYARFRAEYPPGDLGAITEAYPPDRLLLTRREAAERLNVSERTVDRLISAGRLPLVHVERAARLRIGDLVAYVSGLPARPAQPAQPAPPRDDPTRHGSAQ